MKRAQFGRLIALLRREKHDYDGKPWTQARLAELTNSSEHIVGRIERGEKVMLDPSLLLSLANAFDLSSRERMEFFNCALDLDEYNLPHPIVSTAKILGNASEVLGQITLPGFVVDSYNNAVLVNAKMLALFDFIEDLRRLAPDRPAAYNILRFVFSQESQFYDLLEGNSASYLRQSIHFFKMISFRNRATRFYEQMLKAFAAEPGMSRFWEYFKQPKNESGEYIYESSPATLRHPRFGKLDFYSPSTSAMTTPYGPLYLVCYLPASPKTLQIFANLTGDENPVEQFFDWPVPEDEEYDEEEEQAQD